MASEKLPSDRELELLSCVLTERVGRDVAKLYARATGRTLPYSTTYYVLDQMEKAGWVRSREGERGGRRVRFFEITEPGIRARERGQEYHRRLAEFDAELGWGAR